MSKKKLLLVLTSLLVILLVVAAMGCAKPAEEPEPTETVAVTEAPTETPTEAPTEAPTEPAPEVLRDPLTGEVLEEAETDRIVAITINNVNPALPHYGVNEADLFFEMFVNDYATRGLALYTDIDEVPAVGSVRSMRYNFTDLALAYDAIVCHAGGSSSVIADANNSGIDHTNVDTASSTSYAFRDFSRRSSGYAWEHCLFVSGSGVYGMAESKGFRTTMQEDKTYGLNFTEDGTPDGETAGTVSVTFIHNGRSKNSSFTYDAESGKYLFSQYGEEMYDGATGEREAFTNVIVVLATVTNKNASGNTYHVADLDGSGEGYYACGGKLVPIKWSRAGEKDPFNFTLADGTALELGVGNSYIAIAPTASQISWQ